MTTTPQSDPLIHVSIEQLEKLAAESEENVERLHHMFIAVLVNRPDESTSDSNKNTSGSDLGQTLMRFACRFDTNICRIPYQRSWVRMSERVRDAL
jgi:hypothetical protein